MLVRNPTFVINTEGGCIVRPIKSDLPILQLPSWARKRARRRDGEFATVGPATRIPSSKC